MSTSEKVFLAVFAHPDDADFGYGGTIAKFVAEGYTGYYLVVTLGDKGSANPEASGPGLAERRAEEQRAAAQVLGVHEVFFLGYADAQVVYDLALRDRIVRFVRELRPEIVFTHDPSYHYGGRRWVNHPDHRFVGEATLDAVYPCARDPLYLPEHRRDGLLPHKVKEVYMSNWNDPDIRIDISSTIDQKIAAATCHASQIIGRDPGEVFRARAATIGEPEGLAYAEGFRHLVLPP